MNTITRTTQMTLLPEGEPIFSEQAIVLTIDDEAAGEFLKISQHDDQAKPGEIRIDPREWPQLREAIDAMMAEITKHERRTE